MNINATVCRAIPAGMTSRFAQFCIVSGPCLSTPFQLTGNWLISIPPLTTTFNLPATYTVTAAIRLSLPAGATFLFNDVSLQFIQGTTLGAVQVCKVAGPGVTPGTNFLFRVQGPDFHVFLPAAA